MTVCHVLNRVRTKHNTMTPFEEWERKKVETLLPTFLGLFGESQYTNFQEAQAWNKNRGLCSSGLCLS